MITKAYVIANPNDFTACLEYRLQTQHTGRGKVTRNFIKSFARNAVKHGQKLPSGFGVTVSVQAK